MSQTLGITAVQLERVAKDWSECAGHKIEVEVIGGALYAFTDELACLRLLKKYRWSENAASAYSQNLETFYFCLETQQ